jgi:hypothetical protein
MTFQRNWAALDKVEVHGGDSRQQPHNHQQHDLRDNLNEVDDGDGFAWLFGKQSPVKTRGMF